MLTLPLTSAAATEAEPWIVRFMTNEQARLRLFCFPYAGGGGSAFRAWPDYLSPEIEVCAIQPPGRETRLHTPPITSMDSLLSDLGPAITPYLDRPFVFFGHSMGALISFELARWLRMLDVIPITRRDRHVRAPRSHAPARPASCCLPSSP